VVQALAAAALPAALADLSELLIATVDGGSPLGFEKPLARTEAENYWLSLRAELAAGSRVLLVASSASRIVGAGQLALSPWPNYRHRAELQKICVAPASRGRGIGRLLIEALHCAARDCGRSLLVLSTRLGEPAHRLYRSMDYRQAGIIPGWTRGPAGERYAHVTLYREL